jgi:hypothetical protein
MIKKMVQKWLGLPAAGEDWRYAQTEVREADAMLRESGPSIVAYKITNGYVLRTCEQPQLYNNGQRRVPALTYCKDHKEIADHIVAEATKTALGVGQQYELPLTLTGGGTGITKANF